ncbi:MAG: exodeoxyribonuclease VII large subunit [Salegentibacter sp.]
MTLPDKKIYSLSQLTRSIQNVISARCSNTVWIKAEIVKLNHYPKSGHCYPALVEKKHGRVVAEMRGNIWSDTYQMINKKFREILKEDLKDHMNVVIQGHVTYHPVHGLALNITDIDPEYTLGELAKEKSETIQKLKNEGIFDTNKKTHLPLLPKTLAVISVESSKGYQDFLNIINNNPGNYQFHHLLFPAILQGERAVSTILEQLEKISHKSDVFDAVAIIRGGGGEIGLSCFDNYFLAEKIATFPIPVLTGIGHSTNETVSEMVSFQSFITPTKIAGFLLQRFQDFHLKVQNAEGSLQRESNILFRSQSSGLQETARLFNSLTNRALDQNKSELERMRSLLISESKALLQAQREFLRETAKNISSSGASALNEQKHQLDQSLFQLKNLNQRMLQKQKDQLKEAEKSLLSSAPGFLKEVRKELLFSEEKLKLLSPESILKRGYSITRKNGKVVSNHEQLKPKDIIETQVFEGKIRSRVEATSKHQENE